MLVDIDVQGQQWVDFFNGGSGIIDYGLLALIHSKFLHVHQEVLI